LFLANLSRSAAVALTRPTRPTSSKPDALIRHRFDPGFFTPGHKQVPFPNAIALAWVELATEKPF